MMKPPMRSAEALNMRSTALRVEWFSLLDHAMTVMCRWLTAHWQVLFIMVDDLRPEIGSYGATHMHTPNMDALAAKSVLFERM